MIRKKVSRRSFLRGSTLAAAGGGMGLGLSAGPAMAGSRADDGSGSAFQHGIASGDPTQDSVMLWTRVTPKTVPGQGDEKRTVPVSYVVATDPGLTSVVKQGEAKARPDRDYCVKVDVTGLQAGKTYWYAFSVGQGADTRVSPLGRTKTLPKLGKDSTQPLKLGLVSCSSYLHGKFNAYKAIADLVGKEGEPDVILHLGDYIYEYGFGEYGDVREADPEGEIYKLADYRDRHAQYKKDQDLAKLHTLYPMINIWDDHETADNSWSRDAHNHGGEDGSSSRTIGDTEGGVEWVERKNAGRRAFFEWMPIRPVGEGKALQDIPDAELLDLNDKERPDRKLDVKYRIYRSFSFGDLGELIFLDTRLLRNTDEAENQADFAGINSPDRTLLGKEQEAWLYGDNGDNGVLTGSATKWQILAQQIMVGQLHIVGTPEDGNISENESRPGQIPKGGVIFNTDQWDGWQYSRDQLYTAIETVNGKDGNVVVLTGDIHTSWANDITRYPNNPAHYDGVTGRGSIAAEYVVTSVTSPGLAELAAAEDGIRTVNPHMKYIDLKRKGFMLMSVSGSEVSGTWQYLSTVDPEAGDDFTVEAGPTFRVEPGAHYLQGSNPTNYELNPQQPKCDMFEENCPEEAK